MVVEEATADVCCSAVDFPTVVGATDVSLAVEETTGDDCCVSVDCTTDGCSDVEGTEADVFRLDVLVLVGAICDDRWMDGDATKITLLAVEEGFVAFLGCTGVGSASGSDTGTSKAAEGSWDLGL